MKKLHETFRRFQTPKSDGGDRRNLRTTFFTAFSLTLVAFAMSATTALARTDNQNFFAPAAASVAIITPAVYSSPANTGSALMLRTPVIAAGLFDWLDFLGFNTKSADNEQQDEKAVSRRGGGIRSIESKPLPAGAKGKENSFDAPTAAPCGASGVTRTVGPSGQHSTIQAAINASSPVMRDTITVAPGTYAEQLVVNKCVTIVGSGQTGPNATIIQPTAALALSQVPLVNAASIVEVRSSATVTISGLTVSGPPQFPAGSDSNDPPDVYGVLVVESAALSMTDVTVTGIRRNPLDGSQNGFGIRAGSVSFNQIGSLDLTRVTISDYQKGGIIVSNNGSTASIKDGFVTGVGATAAIGQNGIEVSDDATATITGNTISGNLCDFSDGPGVNTDCGSDPVNEFQSAGILLVANGLTTVSGNTISNNDAGYLIFLTQSATAQQVTGNTFTDNRYFAFYLDQSNTFIQNNFISGGNSGAVVLSYGGNTGNTIADFQSNSITGASQAGIRLIDVDQTDTFTPVVTANFNRISNSPASGASVIGIDAAPSPGSNVSAENNFWGCNDGPNGGAGCDTTTGNVDGDPYLVLRAATSDNDLNTGEAATITADLTSNNLNQTLTGRLPDGIPITFSATNGTVNPSSSTLTNGTATTTFTAGGPFNGGDQTAVVTSTVDNANAPVSINVNDTTAPTVTINQAAGQPDPTNASPVNFTVVFDEPVTGFTGAGVTLGGTAGATTATVTETGVMDGTTYNVAVSGMTSNGTVTASVAANAAQDSAGNSNVASTSIDNSVAYFLNAIEFVVDDAGINCLASGAPVYTTIQAAVAAAGNGYIIRVCPGNYPFASTVNVAQTGLTIIGAQATKPVLQIPQSAGFAFTVNAPNVTLDNLEVVKSDDTAGPHNLIYVNANNFTAQNNLIRGPDWRTLNAVTRAFEITSGFTGLLITNNTIQSLRQPAYINGSGVGAVTTGTISNNTVTGTKGFVVAGANVIFTGNTFGQTCPTCGADIALLSNVDPAFYSNLLALSTNNDNAYIQVQYTAAADDGRAVTFVDDSAAANGDGRTASPRQTIQDAVNNTLPGGTVNVAAGTYPETVVVDRALKILGAQSGNLAKPRTNLAAESTIVVGSNTTTPVDIQSDTVTFDGFNFDINQTNPTTNNGADKPQIIIRATGSPGGDGYQNLRVLNNRLPYSEAEVENTFAQNYGIWFAQSTDSLIEGNYLAGFPAYGALAESGSTNLVARNNDTFNNNVAGFAAQGNFTRPAPQLKHNNLLVENNRFDRDEVLLFQVEGGIVRNNTLAGGQLGTGRVNLGGGNNNIDITGNTFSLSRLQGVATFTYIDPNTSVIPYTPNSNVDVIGNTFTRLISPALNGPNSATTGSFAAIDYRGTGGANTIANNTLSLFGTLPTGGNSSFGIRLRGSGSGNFEITGNSFDGGNVTATGTALPVSGLNIFSNTTGSVPADAGAFPATSIVNVICNTFSSFQNGIFVYDAANGTPGGLQSGSNITINNNNILGNSQFGINNGGTSATINAQSNYWGAADGPGPVGSGSGDRVTPNVDFSNFRTAPVTGCANLPAPPPTVTINQAAGQNDPTSTSPITFDVVFSEAVMGFDASDVDLTGSSAFGTGVTPTINVTGSGTTYTVTVSGMNQTGVVRARIRAGAATGASGATVASTSNDNTVTFNFVAGNANNPESVNPTNIGTLTDLTKFFFQQEGATGSGAFVTGPAPPPPPLGIGSAQLTIDSTGREILATRRYAGTRLADITALQYSAYTNRTDGLTITLQFDVDYDLSDANGAFQNRLVYEPKAQGISVTANDWQTFDTLAGKFYSSSTNTNNPGFAAGCTQANPCTKQQLLAAFPNVGILGGPNASFPGTLLLKAGGPFAGGMVANADNLVVGVNGNTTTFDFEPSPPTISIGNATVTEGNGGQTTATFTITQSVASQLNTTVTVNTADGTATTADSDYQPISNGTATILAGQTSTTVTVNVNGDTNVEGNETFTVNLSNAVNAAIVTGTGTGTINNDDVVISFSAPAYDVGEGGGTATITVTRNGVTPNPVSVNYATSSGSATGGAGCTTGVDFINTNGTLTFAGSDTTKTFTVTICDDLISEAGNPEIANLTLSGATGGAALGTSSAMLRIFDNDGAGVVTISGNIKRFNSTPPNTNLAGVTVTLSGSASQTTTTDADGNYSFTGLTAGGSYLVTPSCPSAASCVATNRFDPINRNYNNLFTNVGNADFIGYALADIPRVLQIGNGYTTPGQQVTVAVTINSQGNESIISFSLSYDATLLSNPTVSCGADVPGCDLTVNPTSGSIGIIIEPAANLTAGTRQLVTVTFDTQLNTMSNTPVTFTDTPTDRSVSDDDSNELLAAYNSGNVVFAQGWEGDVANRFTGDGLTNSNDLIIERQFVARLIEPNPMFNEYQRADCAPYATKGNGALNSSDLIQLRRYAADLDPEQTAGGPFQPVASMSPLVFGKKSREDIVAANTVVRIVNTTTSSSNTTTTVTVPIEADLSNNEQGFDFSISYTTSILSNPVITLAPGVPAGTAITPNYTQTGSGRVGAVIDSGTPFGMGTKQIALITFTVAANAPTGITQVNFTSNPIALNTGDSNGNSVPTTYTNGGVNILGPTAAGVTVSGRAITSNGRGIRNIVIKMTDAGGNVRTAVTNAFGYYRFTSVAAGETYVFSVKGKRFEFVQSSQVLTVTEDLQEVNFIAN